jgi:hypothetical protein
MTASNLETIGNSGVSPPDISCDTSTGDVEVLHLTDSFGSSEPSTEDEATDDLSIKEQEERDFFRKARNCLDPGGLFRLIVHFYAERKMIIFFWIHFASTLIIWFHFGLIKWEQQKESVPEGAPRYWWKRVAPSLEFGR